MKLSELLREDDDDLERMLNAKHNPKAKVIMRKVFDDYNMDRLSPQAETALKLLGLESKDELVYADDDELANDRELFNIIQSNVKLGRWGENEVRMGKFWDVDVAAYHYEIHHDPHTVYFARKKDIE